jgi:tetratricopeptide (TPR) repeat protein
MTDPLERLSDALSDRYKIERELGSGGMATVFLAEDLKHHRKVAVKVLRPDLTATLGVERFLREIELAAQLQHPHILPLHDSGEAGGFLYYVMPYVEGHSLRERLLREGELPIADVAQILREVADALSHAHDHGVVHRDIKPDNVMLSGRHAMVTDFGVAKAVSEATGRQELTTAGVALGTPAYMAPEQAAADPHLDHRVDIYAVGALAYEMLTGRPPFVAPSPQAVLSAHMTEVPQPCATRRPAVPDALNALVMRCLEKHPADRWQRADELLPQLEALTTPSAGVTPTGTQPVPAAPALAGLKLENPARIAGLFGVTSVAVLGVVYFLMIQLGLPGWVLPGAIALLVLGLPIVLTTGHIEKRRVVASTTGVKSPELETGFHGWFTWRKTVLVGGTAFAVLALGTVVYMAMRVLGVGPVGTLMATGALEARDRLIVADFENRTEDSTLGPSVTEALRIDLAQSPVIKLLGASDIGPVLRRMNRAPDAPLDRETALEAAERDGVKAVVVGEIGPVGGGYVLLARVLAAADGSQLIGLRESAESNAALIPAIDRLSARLRERIGESLRTIRASEPLERVTTASPDALKKYSQGVRAFDRGDLGRARALLEEATAIDTAFAMAYRKLAVTLNNMGAERSLRAEAATNAFLYRDRLTDIERYLATAYYYYFVAFEPERVRTHYLNVLDVDPDNRVALNNLAVLLNGLNEREEAEHYALRAVGAVGISPNYSNALSAQVAQGAFSRADSTLRRFEAESPDNLGALLLRGRLMSAQRHFEEAEAHFLGLREQLATRPGPLRVVYNRLSALSGVRGRLAASERYLRE